MIFGFSRETAYDATELRKPGLNRNRGASGHGALIEHQYLETSLHQIGGANKTFVAAPDDDHIVHRPPFHKP
jgi:hypothetical protein